MQSLFHAWERRLADVTTDRVVRPFEWGLDWMGSNGHLGTPRSRDDDPDIALGAWVADVMADSTRFYTPEPTTDYELGALDADGARRLTFPSALVTPHPANNTVHARCYEARAARKQPRAAVIVLPQWNADPGGHIGLSRLLALSGMTAVRLSLPYHDWRMPPELHRADFIVSANIARTVQVCRQAVLDVRRTASWLRDQGYERIGILGTSLGSCLSLLSTAHEPLIDAQALNHISPHFADVVWRGLSTRHVRQGLDGHIDLDRLRTLWAPISPWWFLDRVRDRQTLLVYARYDLTFPRDLSEDLVREFARREIPHRVAVLPCGHYTTGKAPFKFVDGWILTRFLKRALLTPDA